MPTYEVTSPDGKKYRVTAPEGATEDDAIDHVRQSAGAEPKPREAAKQFGYGTAEAIAGVPNLAYQGIEAGLEKVTGKSVPELTGGLIKSRLSESPLYQEIHTPAETEEGRYARAIGQGAGSLLPFSLGAKALGAGISQVAPRVGAFVSGAGAQPFSRVNLGAASLGSASAQFAEEAGYGGWGQLGAGLAGGLAVPLGAAVGRRALGAATRGAFTPGEAGALDLRDPIGPPRPGQLEAGLSPAAPQGPPRQSWMPVEGSYESQVGSRTWQILSDAATKAGRTPEEIQATLDQARQSGLYHGNIDQPRGRSFVDPLIAIADVDSAFAKTLGQALRQDPQAATEIRAMLRARKTGDKSTLPGEVAAVERAGIPTAEVMDPDRYAKGAPPLGIKGRMIEMTRRLMRIADDDWHGFGNNADETRTMITEGQRAAAKADYDATRAAAEGLDLGANKGVAGWLQKYTAMATDPNRAKDITAIYKDALGQYAPSGRVAPSFNYIQEAKEAVDRQINQLLKSPDRQAAALAPKLIEMQKEFLKALDSITDKGFGAKFAKARAKFAGDEALKRDLDLGADIYRARNGKSKADFDAIESQYADKVEARKARNRVKLGYQSEFAHDVMNQPRGADPTRLLGSEQKKMEMSGMVTRSKKKDDVFRDRPQRGGRFMTGQEKQLDTERIAAGGSQTAERTMEDAQFDVLHRISDAARGKGATDAAIRGAEYMLNKMFGLPSDVAVNVGRKLLSTNPHEQRYAINQMRMRMGRSKMERFLGLMEGSQTTPGVAGGVAPTVIPGLQ